MSSVRNLFTFGCFVLGTLGAGCGARAQSVSNSDEPSYRKEFSYGINFNTRGGLIGGASVRSAHVLDEKWSRYWSIEGVEVKHPKEQRQASEAGGIYTGAKANYLFVLRPSVGLERIVFRKAPESGVQVSAMLGAGPSIGLLMPYYIYYDYTARDGSGRPLPPQDIRAEQFDPKKHTNEKLIVDRAPLFSGINETKPKIGAHLRGALSFEYGRYRDAVAGVETGFLLELYPKELLILKAPQAPAGPPVTSEKQLNNKFFPSVYLTIYLGHRS
ncbi:hypothetical protein SAMN02745146_3105 [Hymenobacter daecheongensis DSM 21074]|uniref:Outer membrane protein beta-barrel domain-containing protein n=1 Tax=Hymenobacter daecheongensis DSM 21074 TaxID=1121955 RepID=A0A1M6J5F7_9BACT|nr:hypothetical protein [Hymenobacter daecheongensis]SHJ41926.1 hypothetical protein SAMN02745146_3105 [Hymenobacter daecheongensis DSM 21074]